VSDKSGIEWTQATWNPVTGCTKVSQGCKHCYAERMWTRLSAPNMPYEGRAFTDVQCHPDRLGQPLRWKKPRRIFVNSMSDLFHEDVPDEFIKRVFTIMADADQHIFQILTKRPERMCGPIMESIYERLNTQLRAGRISRTVWPLPNVHLGVSVEDQATADERIPLLLNTPAAVRWISAEPLLGCLQLDYLLKQFSGEHRNALTGKTHGFYTDYEGSSLDWLVVGGESGPKARPMHPDWVRAIRDQCQAAGVPFFFKQWGEWRQRQAGDGNDQPRIRLTDTGQNGQDLAATGDNHVWMQRIGKKAAGRKLDGHEWSEYPA